MKDTVPAVPRWFLWLLAAVALSLLVADLRALLEGLRGVLTPVFFAFLIAYMLDPVVDRFEARGLPRAAGIGILLTAIVLVITLVALLVIPVVVRDVTSFASELPGIVERWLAKLEPWLQSLGVDVPHTLDEAMGQLQFSVREVASKVIAPAGTVLLAILGGTASLFAAILGIILVGVLSAYLLYDFDRMIIGIRELIPHRIRPLVVEVAREIDEVMSQFVRGQLTLMVIMAVLYGAAYALLGVRLAVVIGIVAGLLSFIPYVGSGAALILGLLMCLVDWDGFTRPFGVVIAYTIIQLLEGYVLQPRVVGEKVGLPAVWLMVALMAGGELFGFMGVLLAVPAAAVLKILVVRLIARYRTTDFFGTVGAGAVVGAPQAALPTPEQGIPEAPTAESHADERDPDDGRE